VKSLNPDNHAQAIFNIVLLTYNACDWWYLGWYTINELYA